MTIGRGGQRGSTVQRMGKEREAKPGVELLEGAVVWGRHRRHPHRGAVAAAG